MTIAPQYRVTELCTKLALIKKVKIGVFGGRSFKVGDKYLSLNRIAKKLKEFSKGANADPNQILDACCQIKRIHKLGEKQLKEHFFKWLCTSIFKRLPNLFSNPKKAIIENPQEAAEKLCPAILPASTSISVPLKCPKAKVSPEKSTNLENLRIAAFDERLKKIDKATVALSFLDLATPALEESKKSERVDPLDCVRNTAFFTARKSIEETVQLALVLDNQINKLTNGRHSLKDKDKSLSTFDNRFKFDVDKWKNIQNALQDTLSVERAKSLIESCHLDLLEALSEFNIDEAFFLNTPHLQKNVCPLERFSKLNERDFKKKSEMEKIDRKRLKRRFLNRITLPELVDGKPVSPALRSIFERAKTTLKGQFIVNNINYCFLSPLEERAKYLPDLPNTSHPIYLQMRIFNLESPNWKDDYYYRNYRQTRADHFQVDQLLELFSEDERIIFPKEKDAEQVILRFCPNLAGDNFQKRLLGFVLCNNPKRDYQPLFITEEQISKLENVTIARNDLLSKIKEKFGAEFYKKEVVAYTRSRRR